MLTAWMHKEEAIEPLKERWIDVNGSPVRYFVTGNGPDLVALHGMLGSADSWDQVLPLLGAEATAYAVDGVGCGKTPCASPQEPNLELSVKQLHAFLDALNLGRVDLLGTSYGAATAMLFAARYPERVRRLILHAPANPFSHLSDPMIWFYRSGVGRWFARHLFSLPRPVQEFSLLGLCGLSVEVREAVIRKYTQALRREGAIEHQLGAVRNLIEDMKVLKKELVRLKGYSTQILWGTHDRVVSLESGMSLHEMLDRSSLTLLPGVGHLPYEECPEEFSRSVLHFLQKEFQETISQPSKLYSLNEPARSAA